MERRGAALTLVTLLPSSTVSNTGGSIVGAATVHQAWNDSSDSSYVEYANDENSRVHLDDITLPAGAAFVKADAIVRVAGPVRSTKAEAYAISGTAKATKPYQLTASSSSPEFEEIAIEDVTRESVLECIVFNAALNRGMTSQVAQR